jgi:L-ascorbate metabolism protein UlaG (beta-lactamase superfamily)
MPLGDGLELTWYGHATWLLKTGEGKRILIDPWKSGNPVWPGHSPDPGKIDAMLLTHGHSDHTGDAVRMAADGQPDAVVAMIELGDYLEMKGVANVIGINKGGTVEVAGTRVTMTHAVHSSSFGESDGTIVYTGEPASFILRTGNTTLFIAGDTCVFGDMALIARLYTPNVAILPIGGYFTMDPFEAAEAIRLLGVRKVVPTHFGTFPMLKGTPDELRKEAADVSGLEVLDTQPGGTIR